MSKESKAAAKWAIWLFRAASVLFAILFVELILQIAGPEMPPAPLYPGDREPVRDATYDAGVGWKLPPNDSIRETKSEYSVSYGTNAQGFRTARDLDVEDVTDRVVFLGDSFTFGSGVEDYETFAVRLEARLEDGVVYNLGIGGYGIDQMALALEHYGLRTDPTQVVLMFIRNDLDRTMSAYRLGHVWQEKPLFFLDDGELLRMTTDNRPGRLRSWLVQNSMWAGLWRRVENSLSRRWPIGERWELNRAVFERLRDLCVRDDDLPLLVVHLPVNRRKPVPMLVGEFEEMDIDFVDLADHLPEDADRLCTIPRTVI